MYKGDDHSRKQSNDYEQILDQQNAEQNLMSNLSFDSPCEFSLNSSDKEKLIRSDERRIEFTRSSSLYPIERSRLRYIIVFIINIFIEKKIFKLIFKSL